MKTILKTAVGTFALALLSMHILPRLYAESDVISKSPRKAVSTPGSKEASHMGINYRVNLKDTDPAFDEEPLVELNVANMSDKDIELASSMLMTRTDESSMMSRMITMTVCVPPVSRAPI